ncbi:MAG: hypothetical protein ABSB32_07430 [Thermodesulfobacteriota bacterium]|jgi:predicted RNA-binding Zn-ribbon protein involved in translation (DUF1610 family)
MPTRNLDPENIGHDEDWVGNNAAFTCPHCGKVFIVSGSAIHKGVRACPECGRSTGRCDITGKKSGGKASLQW